MGEHRKERLESIMKDLLAGEILKTIEMNGQFITVTSVSVDARYEEARVSVSVFPDEQKKAVLDVLGRHAGQLQHFLLKKIRIKKIPHLIFQ